MTKKVAKLISALSLAVIMAFSVLIATEVFADAGISMTTGNGTVDISGEIKVDVSITSDEQVGTYYIELEYDSSRMRYVNGAESEHDGILTLTGTGMSKTVTYSLNFTGALGGEAGIIVRNALVNNSDGNAVAVSYGDMLQIVVTGQTDSSPSFAQKLAEEEDLLQSDLPIAGSIHDASGTAFYVVDLTRTTPDELNFTFEPVEDVFEGQVITFASDLDGVLKMIPLMDSDDNVSIYAVNGDMFYPMTDFTDNKGNKYKYVTLDACSSMPQKLASDTDMWEYVVYAVGQDGSGGFYLLDGQGNIDLYTVLNATNLTGSTWLAKVFSGSAIPWEKYLMLAAAVIIGIIILTLLLHFLNRARKNRNVRLATDALYDFSATGPAGVDEDISDIDVVRKHGDVEKELENEPKSHRVRKAASEEKSSGRVIRKTDEKANASAPVKSAETPAPEVKRSPKVTPEPEEVPALEVAPISEEKSAPELTPAPEEKPAPESTPALEEKTAPEETPETFDDDDSQLSLDDITLTEEDVPGGVSRDTAPARRTSGTKSIRPSEPVEVPLDEGHTIRFDKKTIDAINEKIAENPEESDDIEDQLKNIEL